jgi:type I restriction enzyme S subunit
MIRLATPKILPTYIRLALEYWIASINVASDITGSAIKNLHLQDLKALAAPIPSTAEQYEIVRRVESAFAHIDQAVTENSRATDLLDRLEQAMIEKAFRGELIVAEQLAGNAEIRTEAHG